MIVSYTADPRVDAYIDALPKWQQVRAPNSAFAEGAPKVAPEGELEPPAEAVAVQAAMVGLFGSSLANPNGPAQSARAVPPAA